MKKAVAIVYGVLLCMDWHKRFWTVGWQTQPCLLLFAGNESQITSARLV